MDKRCHECGSYAINPHLHGRKKGHRLHLCDVCYWVAESESRYEEGFKDGGKRCAELCHELGKTHIDYYNAKTFAKIIETEFDIEGSV